MQSSQEPAEMQDSLGQEVNESLGIDTDTGEESQSDREPEEQLPESAKRRLGMQEKRHKKQMRQMQHQIEEMRSNINSSNTSAPNYSANANNATEMQNPQMHDQVYQAVAKAMQIRDEQDHHRKMADSKRYLDEQFQKMHENLDNASSKYDDFDDVVRDNRAPYSQAMTEAALLLPNADDVLYKLGKDRTNLERISKLHPVDQAREMVKLSFALMSGGKGKGESAPEARPLGNIKTNPVNPRAITENTSVSELRKRMKNDWK